MHTRIFPHLPPAVLREIGGLAGADSRFYDTLSEIRLRAGRQSALTVAGESVPLFARLSAADLAAVFHRLCQHSVYAHEETLSEGYLRIEGGFRVGVAGCAVRENGRVVGVRSVSALSIRLPHAVRGAGRVAVELFHRMGGTRGILVYAPPGVGKTTLLRDAAATLSTGRRPLRVAVVDCRGELCGAPVGCGMLDVLEGYPKALGIEIATRTLAPEVLICDEIGDYEEANAILSVQSSGVPLIASAHGDTLAGLLARPAVQILSRAGVFGAYLGIFRRGGAYTYTVDMPQSEREGCDLSL